MGKLRLRFVANVTASALLVLLINTKVKSQLLIGASSGFHLPGAQDQKFKRYNPTGQLQDIIYSSKVDSKSTTFNSIHLTLWKPAKEKQGTGLRLEYISWNFVTSVEETRTNREMPFDEITQERLAFFISWIKKIYSNDEAVNYFAGLGGGLVLTDVDPGNFQWKHGLQITAGIFRPTNASLQWIIELKYILTYDADNTGKVAGWVVDTSGTPAPFRLGPHLDTRFLTFQFGLQWRILGI